MQAQIEEQKAQNEKTNEAVEEKETQTADLKKLRRKRCESCCCTNGFYSSRKRKAAQEQAAQTLSERQNKLES